MKAEIQSMGESSRNIIGSLLDSEKVLKKLKSFFKGDRYLMFCHLCGFRKDGEEMMLVLHIAHVWLVRYQKLSEKHG